MIKDIIGQLKAKVSSDLKFTSTILLLGRVYQKLEGRVISLESRQLQKGDKGDKGDAGRDGKDGVGRDGKDGKDAVGRDGKDGIDGKDGKDGKAGVGIVDVDVAADNHLVVTLSNGKEIDAGELPVSDSKSGVFVSGNAWQITVSAAAPASPALNDLWMDIS